MRKPRRELKGVAAPQVTTEQVPPGGASDSHRHTYDSLLGKPTGSGAASQLDANGTTLDVNAIVDGEVLKRVGLTIVSAPVGAPGAHAATHEPGGVDPMTVNAAAAVGSLRTLGVGATTAAAGNDARLSDARTPLAHIHVEADVTNLVADLAAREATANKGVAGGYASLDGAAKIPSSQLPAIAITDTFVVASQAAMLALVAQTGDVAVRTDTSQTFILDGPDPTVLADWTMLLTPPDTVISVNGLTGAVALVAADIPYAGAPGIAAVNVEAALDELDLEKEATANKGAASGYASLDATTKVPIAQIPTAAIVLTEAQVTNLVADLAAKALFGVLAGSYDPGSVAMLNAQFLLQYKRLTLSGAERLTVPGTSNVLVLDLGTTAGRLLGQPKTFDGAFTIPHDNFYVQRKRLNLCRTARANLLGNASLIVSDDFDSRNRIALAGRG